MGEFRFHLVTYEHTLYKAYQCIRRTAKIATNCKRRGNYCKSINWNSTNFLNNISTYSVNEKNLAHTLRWLIFFTDIVMTFLAPCILRMENSALKIYKFLIFQSNLDTEWIIPWHDLRQRHLDCFSRWDFVTCRGRLKIYTFKEMRNIKY